MSAVPDCERPGGSRANPDIYRDYRRHLLGRSDILFPVDDCPMALAMALEIHHLHIKLSGLDSVAGSERGVGTPILMQGVR